MNHSRLTSTGYVTSIIGEEYILIVIDVFKKSVLILIDTDITSTFHVICNLWESKMFYTQHNCIK